MDNSSLESCAEGGISLGRELLKLSDLPDEAAAFIEPRNYAGLLGFVESKLQDDPESLLYRLLWVRAQIELELLPTTALGAPLEEMRIRLESESNCYTLSCSTFLGVGSKLAKKSQLRIAVLVLERAFEFASKSAVLSFAEEESIRKLFLAAIESEISRAESRREDKRYISALNKKREEVINFTSKKSVKEAVKGKGAERKHPTSEDASSKLPNRKLFTSKSIVTEANDPELKGSPKDSVEFLSRDGNPSSSSSRADQSLEISPEQAAAELENKRNLRASLKSALFLALFALIIVIPVYVWRVVFPTVSNTSLNSRLALGPTNDPVPGLQLPRLDSQGSSRPEVKSEEMAGLDHVKERLSGLAFDRGALPSDSTSESQANSSPEIAVTEVVKESAPTEIDKPKVVHPELPQINPVGRDNPGKVPMLDPDRLAGTKVEPLGDYSDRSSSNRTSMDGLRTGSDGRIFGPERTASDERRESAELTGPDGRPVRAVPVEELKQPIHYRTIAATEVLSAPSLLAKSVARLEANAKVQVVARMGRWLELRSNGGRRGYIYAQDAVEDREP